MFDAIIKALAEKLEMSFRVSAENFFKSAYATENPENLSFKVAGLMCVAIADALDAVQK